MTYNRIFFLKVPFRSLLTLIVIFRALKDKRRVLVLRKGHNIWVGKKISWKGMWAIRAFVSGKGSVEVLGTKVKGECGEHRWNHLTFTLPLYLCGQRVFFILSPLKHTTLELFLAAVASCLPYDDSMTWPNPESLHLTSLYIPAQDNEDPNASNWLVIYALQQPLMALGY